MNANYRLKPLTRLAAVTAALSLVLAGCGAGRQAFNRGVRAEVTQDYETAMSEYRAALERKPGDPQYRLKYEQARFAAAFDHFERGRRALEAGDLERAQTEFSRTVELDPTHVLAAQELAKVKEALQTRTRNEPPPEIMLEQMKDATRTNPDVGAQLEPRVTGPIDIVMTQDSRVAFETLAELAGINVIFDPDFRSSRIPIELNNVNIYEALDILAMQTRSFWKPVNKSTIVVVPENTTKRREYEEMILKTIYLSNSVTSTEITEAITALRTLLNMRFLAQSTSMNAIIVRDTPDRIAIAEKIIEDLDKSKAEVIVEATVLEVDRNQLRELGILPPQTSTLAYRTPETPAGQTNNSVPLRDLEAINTQNFSINIPDSVAHFLASSSNAKLVQNPRVRATDGKLAQIRIGSKVPVPSGSFQPAFVGATGTPVVQFQYLDIGVNLDITPRVLLNREISMTVAVVVAALAGDRNVGGAILPVFTNRSITHEIRLVEGETNILGGIITDSELSSMSGIPGLKEIPILRYLFGQERKTRDQTEIIIMLTPHIVRMPNISVANMRGVYTGTELNPRMRVDAAAAASKVAGPAPITPAVSAIQSTAPLAPRPSNARLTLAPATVILSDAPTPLNIALTGDNVSAVDLTLTFDPGSVSIAEIREAGLLSRDGQAVALVQRVDSQTGVARITLERPPGAAPISGTGSLLTLLLSRGNRPSETLFKVADFKIRDPQQAVQQGPPAEVRVVVP